ncbi:MAG TPA: SprT-like family protein [Planctomycetota bacterium]
MSAEAAGAGAQEPGLEAEPARALLGAYLAQARETPLADAEITRRRLAIRALVLASSAHVDGPDFRAVHPQDLRRMLAAYDQEFFAARLGPALAGHPLRLAFSRRLTSAGGRTLQRRRRLPDGSLGPSDYEIRFSSLLLFESFVPGGPEARLVGLPCTDRLDALQRILEHELVHLAELLVHGDSSCKRAPFRLVARGLFGHLEHTHGLVTPTRKAAEVLGIRRGDRVRFEFDGAWLEGRVNRITRRATVLVEDPEGEPYSDGRRYRKYLVPLGRLVPA